MEKTCFNCGTPITKEYCEGWPEVCEHWTQKKPVTNADCVRAMSDERLAEFLGNWAQRHLVWMCDSQGECLAWLQEPAKDGEIK